MLSIKHIDIPAFPRDLQGSTSVAGGRPLLYILYSRHWYIHVRQMPVATLARRAPRHPKFRDLLFREPLLGLPLSNSLLAASVAGMKFDAMNVVEIRVSSTRDGPGRLSAKNYNILKNINITDYLALAGKSAS